MWPDVEGLKWPLKSLHLLIPHFPNNYFSCNHSSNSSNHRFMLMFWFHYIIISIAAAYTATHIVDAPNKQMLCIN